MNSIYELFILTSKSLPFHKHTVKNGPKPIPQLRTTSSWNKRNFCKQLSTSWIKRDPRSGFVWTGGKAAASPCLNLPRYHHLPPPANPPQFSSIYFFFNALFPHSLFRVRNWLLNRPEFFFSTTRNYRGLALFFLTSVI